MIVISQQRKQTKKKDMTENRMLSWTNASLLLHCQSLSLLGSSAGKKKSKKQRK